MTAVCGAGQNFWATGSCPGGCGIASGLQSTPATPCCLTCNPKETALQRHVPSTALGRVFRPSMIGFMVGGFVAEWWGWRAAFFVVA